MESNKTKHQIYMDGFRLFVDKPIPTELLTNYMSDADGEATSEFQFWLIDNMRKSILDWCTGIGIIETVEHLYQTALENGNVNTKMGTHWFDNVLGFTQRKLIRRAYGLNTPMINLTDEILEDVYQNELTKPKDSRVLESRFYIEN